MRSVQEREQASGAASESGFFERGRSLDSSEGIRAMDAMGYDVIFHDSVSHDPLGHDPLGHDPLGHHSRPDHDPLGHGRGHSSAHDVNGHGANRGNARRDEEELVLQAFGEVRSLNAQLQRANDTLHGVNESLRGKVDQLRTTTLDLEQMLDGVEVGILLLDEELAVRHFNDMAAHFLGLGDHDVGGSVSASCRGFGPRLVEWCREVLRSGRRIRRTFQSCIGEPLTLHIRRTRVDGEARLILVFSEAA